MNWKTKKLWTATVGSHMWSMNHKGSDIDMFDAFIIETPAILCGLNIFKGKENNSDPNYDIVTYELGHIVRQLTKGNINFLWGLMSPLIHYHSEFGKDVHLKLKEIVENNPSKNYYHAVVGLSRSNLRKYFGIKVINIYDENEEIRFEKEKAPKLEPFEYKYKKKLRMIFRTLLNGIILLTGQIEFPIIKYDGLDMDMVEILFQDLKEIYQESTLPEKPDVEPFNQFLIDTRIKVLNEKDDEEEM